jgi:hypothetical protein
MTSLPKSREYLFRFSEKYPENVAKNLLSEDEGRLIKKILKITISSAR